MRSFTIKESNGIFEIEAELKCLGEDILLIVKGGKSHIGALGFAEPRQSLEDPLKPSATSSVITFPGHKEDHIAKSMAEDLSRRLKKRCIIVAGIHFENLKKKEIKRLEDICKRLADKIASLCEKKADFSVD